MIQEITEDYFLTNILNSDQTSVVILYSEDDYNSDSLLNSIEVASLLITIPIYKINIKETQNMINVIKKFDYDTPITMIIVNGIIFNKYDSSTSTDTIFKVISAIDSNERGDNNG